MYVRYTGTKEQRRGDFDSLTDYADKAGAVGIVAALRADLVEIDEATYLTELAAIQAYNAALPAPVAPPPAKTLTERLAALEAEVAVLKAKP